MKKSTPMLERPQTSQEACSDAETPAHVDFCIGFDLGFAKSPTAAALLGFDKPQPRLIDTHTIRPYYGGAWQGRVSSVLDQIKAWLAIEVLPYYPSLLLAYSLPHGRDNVQTALKLADLGGGVRGVAVGFGLPVIGIQEAESKMALVGSSRADKASMIRAAYLQFGRVLSEHEADAVGHGLAGQANWHREQIIKKAERL